MRTCITLPLLFLLVAASGCGESKINRTYVIPPGISWASLLTESYDLRSLATPVSTSETSRLFSSCLDSNKVVLTSLAPHMLGDGDYGSFVNVNDTPNGVTATLAEFSGPGVITWVWSATPIGTINLYIDDPKLPALTMSFENFLAGKFLPARQPFAGVTSLGHNLHFPIVHAKYCRLTVSAPSRKDLSELFYQVAWQSLPPDATIHPFDAAAIVRESAMLRAMGQHMESCAASLKPATTNMAAQLTGCVLASGQTTRLFHAIGPQAIVAMRFTGKSREDLQGLWLTGVWDGEPAMHAPLHMLAGVSAKMENTQSLPATVRGRQATLRWFMPFAVQGAIICSNAASRASSFTAEIWVEPIEATQYPLRFHANHIENHDIPTDGTTILTLANASGPGRFVGCVLGVDSRSDQWWGEGDQIIWLDNPGREAWHGTGTEDYFGFAWCTKGLFHHPFRGQTITAGDQSHRIAHMHRYHLLDRLPFRQWGKFQFEAWGQGKGDMDWDSTISWYAPAADH